MERLQKKKKNNGYSNPEKGYDLKECTFTPKINRKSRYLDETNEEDGYYDNGPRHELLYNKRLEYKQHKKEIKEILEDEREEEYLECTFQPEKFARYQGFTMNDKLSIDERMEIWERRRAEKLKDWKKENDARATNECTFTPKINPLNEKVLKAYPPNIAHSEFLRSGLQSYFQRKEHARKMTERTKVIHGTFKGKKNSGYSHSGNTTVNKGRPSNVSINQAIISLHDDLHGINM